MFLGSGVFFIYNYDYFTDQTTWTGFCSRHPTNNSNGEEPKIRNGSDGGSVQVRLHGRATPHRHGPAEDASGTKELRAVHQHQVLGPGSRKL